MKRIFVIISFLVAISAVAQMHEPPQPREMATLGTPPPGLPIDDGLIILFAVALIYGVYMVLRLSKKSSKA